MESDSKEILQKSEKLGAIRDILMGDLIQELQVKLQALGNTVAEISDNQIGLLTTQLNILRESLISITRRQELMDKRILEMEAAFNTILKNAVEKEKRDDASSTNLTVGATGFSEIGRLSAENRRLIQELNALRDDLTDSLNKLNGQFLEILTDKNIRLE